MSQSGLPLSFWRSCYGCILYVYNLAESKINNLSNSISGSVVCNNVGRRVESHDHFHLPFYNLLSACSDGSIEFNSVTVPLSVVWSIQNPDDPNRERWLVSFGNVHNKIGVVPSSDGSETSHFRFSCKMIKIVGPYP